VQRSFRVQVAVALACIASLAGCMDADAAGQASETAHVWWGRTFTSTAAFDDGRPRPLEPGTEMELVFEQREEGSILRWNAGCNTWGAPVTIDADRLRLGEGEQSATGCADALDRQDAWLQAFFRSDPEWTRDDGGLRLTADDIVLEFRDATAERAMLPAAFAFTWYGPDGDPAERGRGESRSFEVKADTGPRHCDWESVASLYVAWPPGSTWEGGDNFEKSVRRYVRDPEGVFRGQDLVPDTLQLDADLPKDAVDTGYHTDAAELWWGPDRGNKYAYLVTDEGVERWPRASWDFGCA